MLLVSGSSMSNGFHKRCQGFSHVCFLTTYNVFKRHFISFHFISSHFMSPFSFSVKFSTSDIITFLLFPTVVVLHHPFIMISPASSLSLQYTSIWGQHTMKMSPFKVNFWLPKNFQKKFNSFEILSLYSLGFLSLNVSEFQ